MVPSPLSGAALLKTRVREGDGLLSIKGNGRSGWLTGSEPGDPRPPGRAIDRRKGKVIKKVQKDW